MRQSCGNVDSPAERIQLQLEWPWRVQFHTAESDDEHAGYLYLDSDEQLKRLHKHSDSIGESGCGPTGSDSDGWIGHLHELCCDVDSTPERIQL